MNKDEDKAEAEDKGLKERKLLMLEEIIRMWKEEYASTPRYPTYLYPKSKLEDDKKDEEKKRDV